MIRLLRRQPGELGVQQGAFAHRLCRIVHLGLQAMILRRQQVVHRAVPVGPLRQILEEPAIGGEHPIDEAIGEELVDGVPQEVERPVGLFPDLVVQDDLRRLRGASDEATFPSDADTRDWLPGSWDLVHTFTVPADLAPGVYDLEVALVDRAGTDPVTAPLPPLRLGIVDRGADGWYALSQLTVE